MGEPVRNVFVSYTDKDKAVARRLTAELRTEDRDVWCAEFNFNTGDNFDEIFHAIDSADAFIPVLSRSAVASCWVRKEIRVAVTRQLGLRPLLILPFYVEHCDPPPALCDLKAVELKPGTWKLVLGNLVAALDGKDEQARTLTLEDVVKGRVVVPNEAARFIRNTIQLLDSIGTDAYIDRLMENESVAELTEADREQLFEDIRAVRPVPSLTAEERAELIRFARWTDERIKRFAVALMKLRTQHHHGITADAAEDLLSAEFCLRDDDVRRWKAEELLREATAAGLLIRSREMLEQGFDLEAYIVNPSFDYGPLVPLAGPLVEDWLNRRGLGDDP